MSAFRVSIKGTPSILASLEVQLLCEAGDVAGVT
jgi:hypothetical protein